MVDEINESIPLNAHSPREAVSFPMINGFAEVLTEYKSADERRRIYISPARRQARLHSTLS